MALVLMPEESQTRPNHRAEQLEPEGTASGRSSSPQAVFQALALVIIAPSQVPRQLDM
jgi:hypothetical protein